MKPFIFILTLAISNLTYAKTSPSEIKTCLSSLYTAEKAYHAEKKEYSDSFELIGFEKSFCDSSIKSYKFEILEKNAFSIVALDKNDKELGYINSNKELIVY